MRTQQYIGSFLPALESTFGDRVWFCGYQGSRARGEETITSDMDMVVILDTLSAADIVTYRTMVARLEAPDLACGFLAGRRDLEVWDPADLFWFCLDTIALHGSLDDLQTRATDDDLRHSIWTGLCNLYHGCVHNMAHDRSNVALEALYKSAFFLLREIEYLHSGKYVARLQDLIELSQDASQTILQTYAHMRYGTETSVFGVVAEELFVWVREQLEKGYSAFWRLYRYRQH